MHGLTHHGKVLSDNTQRVCLSHLSHITQSGGFPGFAGVCPAREPEDDSAQDVDTIVVYGLHFHGDGYQVTLTKAKATDDFYASQTALAACVGHGGELYWCQP